MLHSRLHATRRDCEVQSSTTVSATTSPDAAVKLNLLKTFDTIRTLHPSSHRQTHTVCVGQNAAAPAVRPWCRWPPKQACLVINRFANKTDARQEVRRSRFIHRRLWSMFVHEPLLFCVRTVHYIHAKFVFTTSERMILLRKNIN